MAHLVRKESWAVVDLDTVRRRIVVRQDWHYTWTVAKGQAAWQEDEKAAFHGAVNRAIWSTWSRRVLIEARDVRAPGGFKPRDPQVGGRRGVLFANLRCQAGEPRRSVARDRREGAPWNREQAATEGEFPGKDRKATHH